MAEAKNRRPISPPLLLAGTMATAIVIGTVLLWLPFAQEGPRISWLQALFTATSAVCVTGLIVVDTGTQFSFFGQLVILILIQIGGLGLMTIGTTVLLSLGGQPRMSVLRHWLTALAGQQHTIRPRDILFIVFLTTLTAELIGAVILFFPISRSYPTGEAVWLAIFHSVSAFCNAGFSLWSDSLTRFSGDPLANMTVMCLVVLGGVGFVVLLEVRNWILSRTKPAASRSKLSLHSKIVLTGTAVAVSIGAVFFMLLEITNVLADRPWTEKVLIALFQSITARTAGFNTVDIGALANPTLLVLIALMFIGAGPGSAAGGIKLTTAVTVVTVVVQRLRGYHDIHLFGRSIGQATIQRSFVLCILGAITVAGVICFIEIVQGRGEPTPEMRGEFLAVIFEVVSAFGTVGLSMGITADLAALAQAAIVPVMFIGRVGPLLLMDFFARLPPPPPLRHVSEELMIG